MLDRRRQASIAEEIQTPAQQLQYTTMIYNMPQDRHRKS